jgi:hypothetical protein
MEAGYEGTFSPNGALIAVPVEPTGPTPGARQKTLRVAIVDLHDRSADLIPGSEIRQGGALDFSSSGESLFFEAPDGTVMEYRPTAREP